MIVDAFLYNGERDLLDLRMCELGEVVDLFLCVEGALTFQGKPRHISTDLPKQSNFVHLVVEDFPEASARNAWKREMWQRNAILRGLSGLRDDDIVMVSDVDEIPEPSMIPTQLANGEIYRFREQLYQFNFNNMVANDNGASLGWNNTTILRLDDLRRLYPQGIRNLTDGVVIIEGGWHFSWFHNPIDKMNAYSHVELLGLQGTLPERVQQRWQYEYLQVAGTDHLPACVRDNMDKYDKYFAKEFA
jgi:beta-1,4-mannosyl-glycoprotein beta-1,4-N-acetylglucosaminyltransferase